jgi:hypothetical protein
VNDEKGWNTADEAKLEGMVLSRRHSNPAQEVEISWDKVMSNSKDTSTWKKSILQFIKRDLASNISSQRALVASKVNRHCATGSNDSRNHA